MSAIFNDLTNFSGLVQIFEKEIGGNQGDVSGNTQKLKEFTVLANSALDDFTNLALKSSGRWQWDDSNQTDYPIITTNIVSGQRDYSFTNDGSGNIILDIYEVYARISATGLFQKLVPVDAQSEEYATNFQNGLDVTGIPYRYDKTGNGIFLDPIPNYNSTNGLKIYINREASYFTYTDTTKKPGFPGLFHDYVAIKAASVYASRNQLAIAGGRLRNGAYTGLLMQVNDKEKEIENYFGHRDKDDRDVLTMAGIRFK